MLQHIFNLNHIELWKFDHLALSTHRSRSSTMPQSSIPNMSYSLIDSGRIRLLDPVGQGAFGTVYRAQDLSSSQPQLLAVKVVRKLQGHESKQWREITLHNTVSGHDHVVTLHRVLHDDEYLYIVMDYCPSGDLWSAVKRGVYWGNDALVKDVFLQLIDAVKWCHSRGIYHRDLKPNNILVNDDYTQVYLTDFGLASKGKTSTSFGVGTRQFRSPECASPGHDHSHFNAERNDVWALGIIFANVLSGQLPWDNACETDPNYIRHIRNPNYLRRVLPISTKVDNMLQRIFHPFAGAAPSLDELREMVSRVEYFFMDDEEIEESPRLQRVVRRLCPMTQNSVTIHDSADLSSSSDDSDDSLLEDSDDSDEYSSGLQSFSRKDLEGIEQVAIWPCQMLLRNLPAASDLASSLPAGVKVGPSALLTPPPLHLTLAMMPSAEATSATLVASEEYLVNEKRAEARLRRRSLLAKILDSGPTAATHIVSTQFSDFVQ